MDRVHSVDQRPFGEISHAAIAICAVDEEQLHLGLLHRGSQSDKVLLLHLAWHFKLTNSEPGESYLWIEPTIPARRLRQVAMICRKIWRANKRDIPYAFSPPNDCFDAETGEYLLGPTRHGLTCATFVLAVFQSAGLPLIKYEEWPTGRHGDTEWQQKMVFGLRENATAAHIRAIENEVGSVRYRPEEVGAAATISPLPAGFSVARDRGMEILTRLRGGPAN